jgi:hypothetical protein
VCYPAHMAGKIVAGSLITAAIFYTLIVAFIVLATIGFSGLKGLGAHPIAFVIYSLIAMSPLPVWLYCLRRARAWLRGEHPPF